MLNQMQAPGIAMAVILGLLLVLGNATALAAVRLAVQGRITRDTLGGIRTNATRASDQAWEAAHRAAWPWALVLNGAGALGGAAIMWLGTTEAPFLVTAGAAVALSMLGALAQMVVGHRAAERVAGGR